MITINRSHFLGCLEKARKAMPSKSSLVTLRHYLITATNRLGIRTSDLDWGISVSMEAESQPCSFLVPSLLLDVVKSLSDEEIVLIPDMDVNSLTVRSQKGETVLNIFSSEDYPQTPEITGKTFTMDSKLLGDLIDLGGSCAVKNPSRPLWGAICFTVRAHNLEVVSTDQFSLSLATATVEIDDLAFIANAETLKDISKLMSGEVRITLGENMVSFECNEASCFSRLIDGKYYAYDQVIPREFISTIECDRKGLLQTVSRAAIVASDEDRAMRLIVGESLVIKAGSSDRGRMEETVEAEIQGEPVELWLQHRYLGNALKKLESEKVTLSIKGALAPMKVSCSDPKGFFVIMPLSKPQS